MKIKNHGNIPISIIIPVYGRPNQLYRCLKALSDQNSKPQVIVVDDNSPESLNFICKKFNNRLDLTYIRLKENSGPAFARNLGIKYSNYDIIAFTDSDCVPKWNWAYKIWCYLSIAPYFVAGVGGRILGLSNDIFSKYMVYHQILEPHPRNYPLNGQYLYLVTANCAYRKGLVVSMGGFDEELKIAGGEDVGLGLKLIQRGYQLKMSDDLIVRHNFRLNAISISKVFQKYGRGSEHQVKKLFG